uniref:Zinc knuckle CX2CX4HX4C domain-containing protein n=1 Tax=Cannabis sativa TaxID=3483 RepID=A0A803PUY5_CANSA
MASSSNPSNPLYNIVLDDEIEGGLALNSSFLVDATDTGSIMETCLWYFNKKALIISCMKEGSNPQCIAMNTLGLWVQIHDLQTGFMTSTVLKVVGDYISVFVESCPNNFMGIWRDYTRVIVTVDLSKPLKRRMQLRKLGEEWIWITFKYENVPTFCFIYGLLKHSEKYCAKLFDTPTNEITKLYCEWMRAPLRRRTKLLGAQWMRTGFKGGGANFVGGQATLVGGSNCG